MKTIYILGILLIFSFSPAYTQVGVNTDGTPPDASAILDVKSTSKGILIPRMTLNQRNSINGPAEGLMVFCTNCGPNQTGTLSLFTGGEWLTFNLCKIVAPTASVNLLPPFSIVWNWNPVPDATGYKWGMTNSYGSAIDVGTDTLKTETGIECDSLYTRYVWAYKNCGFSAPVILTQSNPNCWTCGNPLTVYHMEDTVAPETKTVSYGTVTNMPGETLKCWITSNLGATHQATAVNDATEASAGWYWQFNRAQGYKYDGSARTPNTTWIYPLSEPSHWVVSKDPCVLEIGNGFRLPTTTEWINVDLFGAWTTWNGPWGSDLKLHAAGHLNNVTGALEYRGEYGYYWSSVQSANTLGQVLYFFNTSSSTTNHPKAYGNSVRCIKD